MDRERHLQRSLDILDAKGYLISVVFNDYSKPYHYVSEKPAKYRELYSIELHNGDNLFVRVVNCEELEHTITEEELKMNKFAYKEIVLQDKQVLIDRIYSKINSLVDDRERLKISYLAYPSVLGVEENILSKEVNSNLQEIYRLGHRFFTREVFLQGCDFNEAYL